MELINKIQTIALSSTAIAVGGAFYSYTTSLNENKVIEEVKVDAPKEKQKEVSQGYKDCLASEKITVSKEKLCGWIYKGLKGVNQQR